MRLPRPAPHRRLGPAFLGALLLATGAAAAEPAPAALADCALQWQVTPQLDSVPRQLLVEMAFDGGNRQRSTLRLPGGWAEVVDAQADSGPPPRLQPVPDAPTLRSVAHAPGERVRLQWRLRLPAGSAAAGSTQLAARWFALAGLGVLPVPDELDERNPPSACVGFAGLPADSRWASSHGSAQGASALFRLPPSPLPLRWRVQQALFAGGALQVQQQLAGGQPVTVAMPADAPWRFNADALAQASALAVAAQRRYWADTAPGPALLVLLLPGGNGGSSTGRGEPGAGAAWHQALALQAGADLAVPGAGFDALIAGALARAWVAERFGPLAHAGRGDEAMRAWFSEGWADFLAHRSLLREGRWTAEDYAATLNRKIERYLESPERAADNARLASGLVRDESGAAVLAARGEWLALQWHGALRAAGEPGLEAAMSRLLVPAAQARREGPISAPLATHRLVAAMRRVLDDAPMRDLTRQIDQGVPFAFDAGTLGPCFSGQRQAVPTWRLGFDAASLARRVVSGVEPGGPAEAAGLRDGMALAGHALVPGDAAQPVRLQVREADGRLRELSYLPAGEPVRDLPRYQPVPQAMQQPACLGWLGLGPEAARAARVARVADDGHAGAAASDAAGTRPASKGKKATAKGGKKAGAKAGTKSSTKAGAKAGTKAKASAGGTRRRAA